MSNLSELLPAGSSVKSADFVAQGTLASGVTVALRSDGKVEAISVGTQVIGSTTDIDTGNTRFISGCYDTTNNKVVVAYADLGSSDYGRARVGTVSGSSISFGAVATFRSAKVEDIAVCFDSGSSKVLIFYKDLGNSSYGTGIVGTVSGTSISFGSAAVFNSASTGGAYGYAIACTYEPNRNATAIFYRDNGDSSKGNANVAVVSGTNLYYGSEVNFTSGGATDNYISACTNTTDNTVNVVWVDPTTSDYLQIKIATIPANYVLAFGSSIVVNNASSIESAVVYDSANNKVVVGWADTSNSYYGKSKVGTSNGATGMTFGTATTFSSAYSAYIVGSFDSTQNKVTFAYTDVADSYKGKASTGTVSGTSISFTNPATLYSGGTVYLNDLVFDPDTASFVYSSRALPNSSGRSLVYKQGTGPNATSFIGITDQAISSAATGKVVCKGGAITNTGLLPLAPVLGTPVSASSSANGHPWPVFDSSNNKVVLSYNDGGAGNAGKSIVGTVSGNSISYGSEVTFDVGPVAYVSAAFDSNANKTVITYRDDGNSQYGTAVVGTVSGTSISFGTPVVFEAASTDYIATTFDSNSNKIVIAYRDTANSNYGTAIVGTVSGTSISFGTPVVYNSGNSEYIAITFDSNSNKVVVAYNDGTVGNLGKAIVGTVSGTSISFGSEATFNATQSNYVSAGFDSNSNKVVVLYSDVVGGSCVVGTVSGTSISFGTETRVGTSTSTSFTGMSFDPVNNKMILVYRAYINSAYLGNLAIGTVSGTSITVSDATTFNAANTVYCMGVYDSNANRTVITYQTAVAPAPAVAVVMNLSSDLTPNTAYFVQDDGTIGTSSTSTKAGTALSTTSLLLTG